uniref:Uncharacterized protein n=2 Tax=Oryza sativa subsp. japonica TaxID=39947 RepID=Q53JN2_ORYSJ|nr:hypothetical protein [Oryza sativa Japonica Group]ABA93286.1 hypothetical protein LOC_Os11g25140 [Oryza sativa Japonica Group]
MAAPDWTPAGGGDAKNHAEAALEKAAGYGEGGGEKRRSQGSFYRAKRRRWRPMAGGKEMESSRCYLLKEWRPGEAWGNTVDADVVASPI